MKKTFFIVWGLLLAGSWLCGCARLPSRPPLETPPVSSGPELLARLQLQATASDHFQARGQFLLLTPDRNFQGNARFLVWQPDRLRLEVVNFWGQSLVTFLSDGADFRFLVYPEGKLYRGPATPGNLLRFIPFPVTLAGLLAIMTGHLDYENYQGAELLPAADPETYLLALTPRDRPGRVILEVARTGLQPVAARWYTPEGEIWLQVNWQDWQEQQGTRMPSEIRLADGANRYQLRLRYREIQTDIPLTLAAFAPPADTDLRELPFPQ